MPSTTTLYRVSHITLDYFLDLTLKCVHNTKNTWSFLRANFYIMLIKNVYFLFSGSSQKSQFKGSQKQFEMILGHPVYK